MPSAPKPLNEDARLRVLVELGILDDDPQDWLDRVTAYCRSRFSVPMCLVSLVDADRQWFMSSSGLAIKETPRSVSFCGHAVADDRMLVVTDATRDGRFIDNPLVTQDPHVRFYAGTPVRVKGQPIGTLCIIDRVVRGLNTEDAAELSSIADAVSWYLAHRKRANVAADVPATSPSAPSVGSQSDDTSDPWRAATTYMMMYADTVEARMLGQVAFGHPVSVRERVIEPWEEALLSPSALSIARRLIAVRSNRTALNDVRAPDPGERIAQAGPAQDAGGGENPFA